MLQMKIFSLQPIVKMTTFFKTYYDLIKKNRTTSE